ncbi:MAG: hypothetical protein IJZ44_08765, partial [Lachnospiraceae bacterium]|nr:hypothetical protein [Lachnospiraceae bacterium]
MKKFKFSATRTLFGTAEKIGEGVAYKVQSIGRAFDMQKSSFESDITFDSGSDQCLEEYVVIEYRSYGIRRIPIEFKPLIWYLSGGEEVPLVRYEDVLIDSNDHSLIIKVSPQVITGLKVEFYREKNERAELSIRRMYTCTREELPVCLEGFRTEQGINYRTIDLSNLFNATYKNDDESYQFDGGRFFQQETESILHIPFQFGGNAENIIRP